MALDEFFTMYHGFKGNFWKVAHQLIFLPPLHPILSFLVCNIKLMIYMLFNN